MALIGSRGLRARLTAHPTNPCCSSVKPVPKRKHVRVSGRNGANPLPIPYKVFRW